MFFTEGSRRGGKEEVVMRRTRIAFLGYLMLLSMIFACSKACAGISDWLEPSVTLMEDGQALIYVENGRLHNISCDVNGTIFFMHEVRGSNISNVYSWRTGDALTLMDIGIRSNERFVAGSAQDTVEANVLDEANNIRFFSKDGNLYYQNGQESAHLLRIIAKSEGKHFDRVDTPRDPRPIRQMLLLDPEHYVIAFDDAIYISAFPLAAELPRRLLLSHTVDSKLHRLFELTHPYVEIIFLDANLSDSDNIMQRLDFEYPLDIYQIDTMAGFDALAKNGLVEDLSNERAIASSVSTYYQVVQQVLSRDGRIIGVPVSMELNVWGYRADLWNAIGLPSFPPTMEDFFILIDEWERVYQARYPTIPFINVGADPPMGAIAIAAADQYAYQLAEKTDKRSLRFDMPIVRTVMEKLWALPCLEYGDEEEMPLVRLSQNMQAQWIDLRYLGMAGYTPIIPPLFDPCLPLTVGARLSFLFMLRTAPHSETAKEYLSFISEHTEKDVLTMLSPEHNQAIPSSSFFSELLRYNIEHASQVQWNPPGYWAQDWLFAIRHMQDSLVDSPCLVSQESIDWYHQLIPYLTFQTDILGGYSADEYRYIDMTNDLDSEIESLNALSAHYFKVWH